MPCSTTWPGPRNVNETENQYLGDDGVIGVFNLGAFVLLSPSQMWSLLVKVIVMRLFLPFLHQRSLQIWMVVTSTLLLRNLWLSVTEIPRLPGIGYMTRFNTVIGTFVSESNFVYALEFLGARLNSCMSSLKRWSYFLWKVCSGMVTSCEIRSLRRTSAYDISVPDLTIVEFVCLVGAQGT